MIRYGLVASLVLLGGLVVADSKDKPAPGSFVVSFQTESYQGKYAPRNVLAVWIVDANNQYVKDLAVYGTKYATKLGRWRQDSGKSRPDATTGATRKQHDEVSVVWDGTDAKGKPLPDGQYKVRIEYTETNRQGPAFQIPIEKGKETGTREVKGNDHFSHITVQCVGTDDAAAKN